MRPVRHLCVLAAFGFPLVAAQDGDDPWQVRRNRMVEKQIVLRDVTHPATLAAMRKVPRHLFVPEELRLQAYADGPLPIGHGQTISQPYIVAKMTELIAPTRKTRVLEIGTGSGYQTAILAEICDRVFTIEIIPDLASHAAALFHQLGYKNIQARTGDGWNGWPEESPFDAIIVTAAPDSIPPPLFDQLKEGGAMVIPVGSVFGDQDLRLVTKLDGKMLTRTILPVRFVPLVGGRE
jgi:protein-L-isoaspartate(D-aspartate) O-methyltransferase